MAGVALPQLLSTINTQTVNNVAGVTQLGSGIFVVHDKSSIIQVYQSSPPFSRLADIKIDSMKDPVDMVSCQEYCRLLIADFISTFSGVLIVDIESSDATMSSNDFFRIRECRPERMSINSRRLIVTPPMASCFDSDHVISFFVYEIEKGKLSLLQTIKLSDKMVPCHAVETTHSTFIVQYGPSFRWDAVGDKLEAEGDQVFGVAEVNADGVVIRQACYQQAIIPGSLAIASDKLILIADANAKQLVLLDGDLEMKTILLNREKFKVGCKIRRPARMNYNKENKRLIIGVDLDDDQSTNDRILIYQWA
jgi:hypothetical protein